MSSQSLTLPVLSTREEEKQLEGSINNHQQPNIGDVKPSSSSNKSLKSRDDVEGNVQPGQGGQEEHEYVTGMKLLLVIAAITIVCFLMLLDISIITTVRLVSAVRYL